MKISINQAFKLWDKYYLPNSLRYHSTVVAKVVTFISQKYLEKDLLTKEEQVRIIISAILHDNLKPIDKYVDLDKAIHLFNYTEEQIEFWQKLKKKRPELTHEELAHSELKDDYPLIAEIIKSHGFWFDTKSGHLPSVILGYSDLRSGNNKVFCFEERLLDLQERYKNLDKEIMDWINSINKDNKFLKLEKEIFSKIGAEPEDCNKLNNITLDELFKQHNIDKDQEIEG